MKYKPLIPWAISALLLVALVLSLVSSGCRYIQLIDDEETLAEISIPEKNENVRTWLEKMRAAEGPDLEVQAQSPRVLRIGPGGAEETGEGSGEATALLSFVQISDVQLRDERVKLWGPWLSRLIDSVVESNEYGVDQERFDSSVYLALIKAINRKAAAIETESPGTRWHPPFFVVHTGDAVHAGVLQELWEFLWITDQLELPWFQVIGNHDHTAFGTAIGDVTVRNPQVGYLPIGNWENFVKFHGHAGVAEPPAIFPPGVTIAPPGAQMHPATGGLFDSDAHGFDLCAREDAGLGCYAITVASCADESWKSRVHEDLSVRFLFLNTAADLELDEGRMSAKRLAWVAKELEGAKAEGEYVLVFAHHGFGRGMDAGHESTARLRQLLLGSERLLGCFTGHTHHQYVDLIRSEDGKRAFWQVVAPSILEYPQAGLYVSLLRLPDDRLALELRRFHNGYPALSDGEDPDPFAGTVEDQLRVQAQRARRDARQDLEGRGLDPQEADAFPPHRLLLDLHWKPKDRG